jgi:hypothetical protein
VIMTFVEEILIVFICRDLHVNRLTGVIPKMPFLHSDTNINFATNFFVGPLPSLPPDAPADFRFNYIANCSTLCCLLNADCSQQCPSPSSFVDETPPLPLPLPLPLGVEKSVWTELNVTLLGKKKRIIQIETQFSTTPNVVKSFGCPNTSALVTCNPQRPSANVTSPGILLETNVSITRSQSSNTYLTFVYVIQGDACSSSVKVTILHLRYFV